MEVRLTNGVVSTKIIKPENCLLGFGIPTNKDDFYEDQRHPAKRFAKYFNGVWAKYDCQIVRCINKIEPKIVEYGATIVHRLSLQKFGEMLSSNKFDVVVLFSHWEDDSVEFYDGMADISAVINQIPLNFSGILDLSICHPIKLTIEIKKKRPNCLVKFTNKAATPFIWLYFYEALFWHLKNNNKTYLSALEEVIDSFLTHR